MVELPINWGDVARVVLLSRELDLFEEKHLAPQGKVKYQFSAKGHELSQVLLAQALDHRANRHDAGSRHAPPRRVPHALPHGRDEAPQSWHHDIEDLSPPHRATGDERSETPVTNSVSSEPLRLAAS